MDRVLVIKNIYTSQQFFVESVLTGLLNELIPEIRYLIGLLPTLIWLGFDKISPFSLTDKNAIYRLILGPDEILLPVKIQEIVCKQILFATVGEATNLFDCSFFRGQIRNEIIKRIKFPTNYL